jgi:hypothetical protein
MCETRLCAVHIVGGEPGACRRGDEDRMRECNPPAVDLVTCACLLERACGEVRMFEIEAAITCLILSQGHS